MTTAQALVRKPSKGEATRAQILQSALEVVSESGFESLTIGSLAERTGLSKSGLFAHFGSKLELQIATLDEAARRFAEAVFLPAMRQPRGLQRLTAIFDNWLDWAEATQLPGGCPIYAAAAEYDDRPGPMRDAVAERERLAEDGLAKAIQLAVDAGELARDTDVRQLTFEMIGIVLVTYQSKRLLDARDAQQRARAAFDRLIHSHRAVPRSPTGKRRAV